MTNDQWQMKNSRRQSDPVYLSLVICHFEEIATPLPGRIRLLQYSRGERVTFCCRPPGPLASDELYPGRYVRSEQQSQQACGPQPAGALAPKCEFISARALSYKGAPCK